MNKFKHKGKGFSLIELIVAIVVLSIGVTAFITLIVNTTRNSVDPQIRVQGDAIARAYLEEVMLNSFCDPDWDPDLDLDGDPLTNPQNCPVDCGVSGLGAGTSSACTNCKGAGTGWTTESRGTYDDVCDYNFTDVGARDQTGVGVGGLEDYTVTVKVEDDATVDLNSLSGDDGQVVRIDVTVTHKSGATMALSSYKTNF